MITFAVDITLTNAIKRFITSTNVAKPMKRPSFIFSKDDRDLLIGILRGEVEGTNGVPIDGYTPKIQEIVKEKGQEITLTLVRQRLHQKTNNQVFWQSVYEVTDEHRPGLFKKLRVKRAEPALT